MNWILAMFLLFSSLQLVAQRASKLAIDDLPRQIEYVGTPKEIIAWEDKLGQHIVIITELQSGEFFTPSWRSEIIGEKWTKKIGNDYSSAWRIKDFSSNFYTKISYLTGTFSISDLDSDGISESCFLYEINPDGMDPLALKLMLHVNEVKLAVRGKIPKTLEDLDLYEKKMDNSFDTYDSIFKQHASQKWDKMYKQYQEKYMKVMKE